MSEEVFKKVVAAIWVAAKENWDISIASDGAAEDLSRAVLDAMPRWQPIETAPKVGVFLVYLPNEFRKFEVMYRTENASIIGGAFGFDRSAPTHWLPLPTPPTTQEESEKRTKLATIV